VLSNAVMQQAVPQLDRLSIDVQALAAAATC
jgi:hypothetical protein